MRMAVNLMMKILTLVPLYLPLLLLQLKLVVGVNFCITFVWTLISTVCTFKNLYQFLIIVFSIEFII